MTIMGTIADKAEGLLEKAGDLAKKAPGMAKKMAKEQAKEQIKDLPVKGAQNLWGRVCTWTISDKKNQNRCKALERLPDIAKDGAAAVGSCTAAAATGGLTTPAGLVTTAGCGYYSFKTWDSSNAMTSQWQSGEEVKTLQEQFAEKGEDAAGAYIKGKAEEWKEKQVRPPPTYMPMPFEALPR
jgi:hypothetical protein